MNADVLAAMTLGAGFGASAWLLYSGVRPGVLAGDPASGVELGWLHRRWERVRRQHPGRRLAIAAAAGILATAWTGWPVAALLAVAGAWVLPNLLGRDTSHEQALVRIEAIATWTEQLRDTLSAAAGLEQAVLATATTAPVAIRPQIAACAQRVRCGERLPDVLRQLAEDLADPLGDLVIIALIGASGRTSGRLADVLTSLALSAREQAQMRSRTAASRARVRTSVQIVVSTALGMAFGLALLDRSYLKPYGSVQGQLVLLLIGGLFAGMFVWLRAIATLPEPARLLAPSGPSAAVGSVPVGPPAMAGPTPVTRAAALRSMAKGESS